VAIIRGEWDGMCPDADARWLFDALSGSSLRRDIKIGRATHLMHLEENRFARYRETECFLSGGRQSLVQEDDMNDVAVIHGYDYGTNRAARSPVALDEFRALEQTVGWTQTDSEALVMVGDVLAGQEEAMVDS
jgi:hypothetical protein